MLGNFGKMHCLQCKKVKEEGQNRTNKMHSHMAQQPRLIALACTRTTLLQIVPQPKLLLSDDTGHRWKWNYLWRRELKPFLTWRPLLATSRVTPCTLFFRIFFYQQLFGSTEWNFFLVNTECILVILLVFSIYTCILLYFFFLKNIHNAVMQVFFLKYI